jgi:hypothetical protein
MGTLRLIVRRITTGPTQKEQVVAKFGNVFGGPDELRNMLSSWLEATLGDILYEPLAKQTGRQPRWFAGYDANRLLEGRPVQIGWKRSSDGSFTTKADGRVVDWVHGAIVFHDPDWDITYYPVFFAAEVRS